MMLYFYSQFYILRTWQNFPHNNLSLSLATSSLQTNNSHNTSLAAPGALAHRLQRRTACNAALRASGPQNGRRGLERCLPLGFGALPSTFAK